MGEKRTETEKKETVIASHEDTDLARVLIGKKGRGSAAGEGGGLEGGQWTASHTNALTPLLPQPVKFPG